VAQEDAGKGEYQVPLEVYDQLERATPEERADIVLRLIEEHPEYGLELPAREGKRANLAHVNLSPAALRARLENLGVASAPWWDADLQRADLLYADLQGANLLYADLRGAMLEYANLQGASLVEANFEGADLRLANLQRADLLDAKFQGANLAESRRDGVDLSTCDLTHISISGAWLDRTRLWRWEQLGGAIGEELEAEDRKLEARDRAWRYGEAKRGYLALK